MSKSHTPAPRAALPNDFPKLWADDSVKNISEKSHAPKLVPGAANIPAHNSSLKSRKETSSMAQPRNVFSTTNVNHPCQPIVSFKHPYPTSEGKKDTASTYESRKTIARKATYENTGSALSAAPVIHNPSRNTRLISTTGRDSFNSDMQETVGSIDKKRNRASDIYSKSPQEDELDPVVPLVPRVGALSPDQNIVAKQMYPTTENNASQISKQDKDYQHTSRPSKDVIAKPVSRNASIYIGERSRNKEHLPDFLFSVMKTIEQWNERLAKPTKIPVVSREEIIDMLRNVRPAWGSECCSKTPQHAYIVLRLLRSLLTAPHTGILFVRLGSTEIYHLLEALLSLPQSFLNQRRYQETLVSVVVEILLRTNERSLEITSTFFRKYIPNYLEGVYQQAYLDAQIRRTSLLCLRNERFVEERKSRFELIKNIVEESIERGILILCPAEMISILLKLLQTESAAASIIDCCLQKHVICVSHFLEIVQATLSSIRCAISETSFSSSISIERDTADHDSVKSCIQEPGAEIKRTPAESNNIFYSDFIKANVQLLVSLFEKTRTSIFQHRSSESVSDSTNRQSACLLDFLEWIHTHEGYWSVLFSESILAYTAPLLEEIFMLVLPSGHGNCETFSLLSGAKFDNSPRNNYFFCRVLLTSLVHMPSVEVVWRTSKSLFDCYLHCFFHAHQWCYMRSLTDDEEMRATIRTILQRGESWKNSELSNDESCIPVLLGSFATYASICMQSEPENFPEDSTVPLNHIMKHLQMFITHSDGYRLFDAAWYFCEILLAREKPFYGKSPHKRIRSGENASTCSNFALDMINFLLSLCEIEKSTADENNWMVIQGIRVSTCITLKQKKDVSRILNFCFEHPRRNIRFLVSALRHKLLSTDAFTKWYKIQVVDVKVDFLQSLVQCVGCPTCSINFFTTDGSKAAEDAQLNTCRKATEYSSISMSYGESEEHDCNLARFFISIASEIEYEDLTIIECFLNFAKRLYRKWGSKFWSSYASVFPFLKHADKKIRDAAVSCIMCMESHDIDFENVLEDIFSVAGQCEERSFLFPLLVKCAAGQSRRSTSSVIDYFIRLAARTCGVPRFKSFEALRSIAEQHKSSIFHLCMRSPQGLLSLLRDSWKDKQSTDVEYVLETVLEKDLPELLAESAHALIPILISQRDVELLDYFCKRINIPVSEICEKEFAAIAAALLVSEFSDYAKNASMLAFFVEDILKGRTGSHYFERNEKQITQKILMSSSEIHDQELKTTLRTTTLSIAKLLKLKTCDMNIKRLESRWNPIGDTETVSLSIREFVASHIFGLLDIVCGRLQVGKENTEVLREGHSTYDLRSGINALRILIHILGERIVIVAQKIRLLNPSEFLESFYPELVVFWRDFMRTLPESYMKIHWRELLVETFEFAGARTCLEDAPYRKNLLEILQSILSERNADILRETEDFFPEYDAFRKTNLHEKKSSPESLDPVSLQRRFRFCTEALKSDSLKCRFLYIKKMRLFLSMHIGAIRKISPSKLEGFQRELLVAVRDHTSIAQHAAACLGYIGAIAPSLLSPHLGEEKATIIENLLSWKVFAAYTIEHFLICSLHTVSDTKMHDRAAFAIQTLIRTCCEDRKILLKDLHEGKSAWWNTLPTHVKEVIQGFVHTSYEVKVMLIRDRKVPEYTRDMSYSNWVRLWYTNISSRAENLQAGVFQALRNVAKRDVKLSAFAIPYVVHCLLLLGTDEDRSGIATEILAILENSRIAAEHTQFVFSLLDGLDKWCDQQRGYIRAESRRSKGPEDSATTNTTNVHLRRVSDFRKCIPMKLCIKAAYTVGAFARSLRYAELHTRNEVSKPLALDNTSLFPIFGSGVCAPEDLVLLQSIYAELSEPDSASGVTVLKELIYEKDNILDNETQGLWNESLRNSELCLQQDPTNPEYQLSVLKSLKNLGQLQIMRSLAESFSRSSHDSRNNTLIKDYSVQGAWRLSQWECIPIDNSAHTYDIGVGKVLSSMHLSLRSQQTQEKQCFLNSVHSEVNRTRKELIPSLAAASNESYERSYPLLLQLHSLGDLEFVAHEIKEASLGKRDVRSDILINYFAIGRNTVDPTPPSLEVVSSLHRTICNMLARYEDAADTWAEYSQVLRKFDMCPSALAAIMQAEFSSLKNKERFSLLHAKILFHQGEQLRALSLLENTTRKHSPDPNVSSELKSKWMLKTLQWNILTNQKTPSEIQSLFDNLIEHSATEKSYAELGDFLENIYANARAQLEAKHSVSGASIEEVEKSHLLLIEKFLPRILSVYGQALGCGHSTVYRTLPKFLSRWLDATSLLDMHVSRLGTNQKRNAALAEKILLVLHKEVDAIIASVPPYVFMTAISQLVSRVGHRNADSVLRIKQILMHCLMAYPRPSLWYIYFVTNSTNGSEGLKRAKVVREVLDEVSRKSIALKGLIGKMGELVRGLISIASQPISGRAERTVPLRKISGFNVKFPTEVLLPTQEMLSIRLPTTITDFGTPSRNSYSSYDRKQQVQENITCIECFPQEVTIQGICEDIQVIMSLQKPKRIALKGSNGYTYHFLCKARDETRKDSRMMEYSSMINRLTKKNAQLRRRRIHVRTFAVLPVSDDCGIIEWVNKLVTLRAAADAMYQREGLGLSTNQLKALKDRAESASRSVYRLYTEDVLPNFPPLLHKWFMLTFLDPGHWFSARLAFTRCAATFSMVGHIVGLGDRHGENLMLDQVTGECLHVDFACLFDKGETLEVPERVRFRLTPNMVDAMGITGVEGVFRRSCELTLRLQQDNRDTLMGILESFIHDPLVEWSRAVKHSHDRMDSRHMLRRVDRRFMGYPDLYGEACTHSLNVEGVVQKLIGSSCNVDNLSKMYFWWMPWL